MKADPENFLENSSGDVPREVLLRYVNGNATPGECRWIEDKMADDPFLSDAVEGLFRLKNPEFIQDDLEKIQHSIGKETKARRRNIIAMPRWVQVAAALLILVAGVWFVNERLNNASEKLFTNEFQPYPPPAENKAPAASPAEINQEATTADEKPSKSVPQKVLPKVLPSPAVQESVAESYDEDETTTSGTTDLSFDQKEAAPQPQADEMVTQLATVREEEVAKQNTVESLYQVKTENKKQISKPAAGITETQKNDAGKDMVTLDKIAADQQTDSLGNLLDNALEFYYEKNYPAAIHDFEKVLAIDNSNETANFYAGVSYLALNNAGEALKKLKKIDGKKQGQYYESTLWYEALAYIQSGDKKAASGLLEKVVKLNGEHKEQAAALLQKL